jgi:3-phosphoshikimate 1-carboxyvinyltransferase
MSFHGGSIKGVVSPPPSKSHTHRAFLLAAMAKGKSVISNPLMSADTKDTLKACRAMGAEVCESADTVTIHGGNLHAPKCTVDTGNSGTTMRLYAGICSMFDSDVTITGDESLRKRPMGPLLDSLGQAGVICTSENGLPPVTIRGPNNGGTIHINGGVSSQYISSLMLVSPMLSSDTRIVVDGNMVSTPYLDVTSNMMRLFGAKVSRNSNVFSIEGNTGYIPHNYSVPSDFSSAAFPLVAGALGGETTVTGMDLDDPQGDKAIVDILRQCGCEVNIDGTRITSKSGHIKSCDINLGMVPDLFPIVAILLATADGDSRLYGAPQLKYKESNRIETVVNLINSIGGSAEGTDDGCIIHGTPRLKGGKIVHRGDHRLMMCAAIASLVCDGPIEMDDVECCAVSYPDFLDQMKSLGMIMEAI